MNTLPYALLYWSSAAQEATLMQMVTSAVDFVLQVAYVSGPKINLSKTNNYHEEIGIV